MAKRNKETPADEPKTEVTPMQGLLARIDLDALADHIELTEHEASNALGLAVATLRLWRHRKIGPAYLKYCRSVRYRVADLKTFRAARRRRVETDDLLPKGTAAGPRTGRKREEAIAMFGRAPAGL